MKQWRSQWLLLGNDDTGFRADFKCVQIQVCRSHRENRNQRFFRRTLQTAGNSYASSEWRKALASVETARELLASPQEKADVMVPSSLGHQVVAQGAVSRDGTAFTRSHVETRKWGIRTEPAACTDRQREQRYSVSAHMKFYPRKVSVWSTWWDNDPSSCPDQGPTCRRALDSNSRLQAQTSHQLQAQLVIRLLSEFCLPASHPCLLPSFCLYSGFTCQGLSQALKIS